MDTERANAEWQAAWRQVMAALTPEQQALVQERVKHVSVLYPEQICSLVEFGQPAGHARRNPDGSWEVYLNACLSPGNMPGVAAHEIAHVVLDDLADAPADALAAAWGFVSSFALLKQFALIGAEAAAHVDADRNS